jgi:hypothetical protein
VSNGFCLLGPLCSVPRPGASRIVARDIPQDGFRRSYPEFGQILDCSRPRLDAIRSWPSGGRRSDSPFGQDEHPHPKSSPLVTCFVFLTMDSCSKRLTKCIDFGFVPRRSEMPPGHIIT